MCIASKTVCRIYSPVLAARIPDYPVSSDEVVHGVVKSFECEFWFRRPSVDRTCGHPDRTKRAGLFAGTQRGRYSTLLKLIAGELTADDEEVTSQPGTVIARLAQEIPKNKGAQFSQRWPATNGTIPGRRRLEGPAKRIENLISPHEAGSRGQLRGTFRRNEAAAGARPRAWHRLRIFCCWTNPQTTSTLKRSPGSRTFCSISTALSFS